MLECNNNNRDDGTVVFIHTQSFCVSRLPIYWSYNSRPHERYIFNYLDIKWRNGIAPSCVHTILPRSKPTRKPAPLFPRRTSTSLHTHCSACTLCSYSCWTFSILLIVRTTCRPQSSHYPRSPTFCNHMSSCNTSSRMIVHSFQWYQSPLTSFWTHSIVWFDL